MSWRLPIGASADAGGTHFRVWAPQARHVELILHHSSGPRPHPLTREAEGYFAAYLADVGPGARYSYSLDGGDPRPDPASRFQPEGVHGPSEVVDPNAFTWSDDAWRGVPLEELIVYELHVGTATPAGTFDSLIERLDTLKELGVNAIELMPVAAFPGERNWGYDGVDLFAPAAAYGGPEGLRRLVDAAHARGLAVLLDVVYNHLGPDGNYLWSYTRDYFTGRHKTPWGDALNFDGPTSRPVRDFFIGNALYWAHEFHLDGLRLDATDMIIDDSPVHLIAELTTTVRESLPAGRSFLIFAENGDNEPKVVRPASEGGWGCDGVWADDFHHQVRVSLTGEHEGYYADYKGGAEDLAATVARGWFYEGQPTIRHGKPRGHPASEIAPPSFVFCIQNHDQVGNRPAGERLNHEVSLAAYKAVSALLLLVPQTPLIWMGQEWAATTPFTFFTDHNPELGRLVTEGRRKEFAAFTAFSGETVPDPQALDSFTRSKLAWEERDLAPHHGVLRLYKALLELRRTHPAMGERERGSFTATPVGQNALLLRRRGPGDEVLMLALCLSGTAQFDLGAATGGGWRILLDSEGAVYGGEQPAQLELDQLRLAGPGAVVLTCG